MLTRNVIPNATVTPARKAVKAVPYRSHVSICDFREIELDLAF